MQFLGGNFIRSLSRFNTWTIILQYYGILLWNIIINIMELQIMQMTLPLTVPKQIINWF